MSYTPTTAWGPVSALCESARSGGQSYKTLLKSLDVVLDNELWREFVMPPERVYTFARFDEFLKFAGFPPDELLAVLRAHGRDELAARVRSELGGELAEHGEIGNGRSESRGSDTTSTVGRDATYLVSRLKRDEPELAQQVLTGKISANAAAVQAGIRHAYIRVRADDVQLAVVKLLERYDRDDVLGALGVRP
jgi:hypothetical protein